MKNINNFIDMSFPLEIEQRLTITLETLPKTEKNQMGQSLYVDGSHIIRRLYKAENISLDKVMIQKLQDFYFQMHGEKSLFRLRDPFYNIEADRAIGVGNGLQKEFKISSLIGDKDYEDIMPINATVNVKLDGIDNNDYIVSLNNIIFNTPPDIGVNISASFEYDIIVGFLSDITVKPKKGGFNLGFMLG